MIWSHISFEKVNLAATGEQRKVITVEAGSPNGRLWVNSMAPVDEGYSLTEDSNRIKNGQLKIWGHGVNEGSQGWWFAQPTDNALDPHGERGKGIQVRCVRELMLILWEGKTGSIQKTPKLEVPEEHQVRVCNE